MGNVSNFENGSRVKDHHISIEFKGHSWAYAYSLADAVNLLLVSVWNYIFATHNGINGIQVVESNVNHFRSNQEWQNQCDNPQEWEVNWLCGLAVLVWCFVADWAVAQAFPSSSIQTHFTEECQTVILNVFLCEVLSFHFKPKHIYALQSNHWNYEQC